MANNIYKSIQQNCKTGVVDGKQVYTSANQHWLIGAYRDLSLIAPKLRAQPDLLGTLRIPTGKIRFGLRMNDTFSTLSRIRSFRRHIEGRSPDELPEYLIRAFMDKRTGGHNGQVRLTDLYKIAHDWYEKATPEVHHIVEKDLLHKLSLDHGELAPDKAPCVMVVAELHRRLFTPEGSKHRQNIIAASTQDEALKKLKECNTALYTAPAMSDIAEIGSLIINELIKPTP